MVKANLLADTIAAIATPMGAGGIGIVRISGPEAFAVLEAVFSPYGCASAEGLAPRALVLGRLQHPDGSAIDEILAVRFPAPASYTAEDVAELHCHGGSTVLREALHACLAAGARLAEPGEFTLRAFLNGRLDLSQAEAVQDIIQAKTKPALALAEAQLGGALGRALQPLEETLLDLLARLGAAADFPEEIEAIQPAALLQSLQELDAAAAALLAGAEQGRIYREGLAVVLFGPANAGKSSLLNALLGEERAIVTAAAGTTRDVIEESLNLSGLPLVLRDTAGLREAKDEAEAIGIGKGQQAAAAAALLLLVSAADAPLDADQLAAFLAEHAKQKILLVCNKSDQSNAAAYARQLRAQANGLPLLLLSAKTGEGLPALRQALLDLALDGQAEPTTPLGNVRHQEALLRMREHLHAAIETLKAGLPQDLAAVDLEEAWQALGEISGKTAGESVLDAIFSTFCLGK